VVLATVLTLTACGSVDRGHYVNRNEAIVKSLPVFPGAAKAHEFSTPYYSGGGMSPHGYTTTVVYRVPAGTDGLSVRRFYEARLEQRGWRSSVPDSKSPRAKAVAYLMRGKALVILNTITLRNRDRMYMVVVDYRH
jgi:hypothetical protein